MTLMFFAGMWCMALLNLLCFGVHKYLKKREKSSSRRKTSTARHVSVSVHDHDQDSDTDTRLSDTQDRDRDEDQDIDDGVEDTQMSDEEMDGRRLRKHSEQMALKNLTPSIDKYNELQEMPTIADEPRIATHATDESL